MSDIRFELFDRKDLDHQRSLFQAAFPETKGTAIEGKDHYTWKFTQFPASPSSYEYCGWIANKMASYYAALPYRYKINDTIGVAGMVCDVMTHPQQQGKGLFTKMGKFATEHLKQSGLDFTTGYPIRPEVIPGHVKVGWEKAFYLPMYLRPLSPRFLLKKFHLELLNIALLPLAKIFNWFFIWKSDSIEKLELQSALGDPELRKKIETFFEEQTKKFPHYLIKDASFLRWRFSAPESKYFVFLARDKSTAAIESLAIASPTVLKGVPTIAILDIAYDNNPKNLRPLVSAIVRYAYQEGKDVLAIMCSKHIYQQYELSRVFFLPTPFKFLLIIKNLSQKFSSDTLLKEDRWNLMWVDSDDL